MGNSEPTQKSSLGSAVIVEHPRFSKARLSIDKRMMVLEGKWNCIDMMSKIATLNPQNKKLPLLLPKLEETHS